MFRIFSLQPEKIRPQTRFSKWQETKNIEELIDKLSAKNAELDKEAWKSNHSLEHKKHKILYDLLEYYNQTLKTYNEEKASQNKVSEIRELIIVLNKLHHFFQDKVAEGQEDLIQFRAIEQAYAKTVITTACAALTSYASTPVALAAGALISVGVISGNIEAKSIKSNPYPESYTILLDLLKCFNQTIELLMFTLNLNQLTSTAESIKLISTQYNMVCPISKKLIKSPMLCKLDGFCYEESYITTWLESRACSYLEPSLRMSSKQSISSILVTPSDEFRLSLEQYRQHQVDQLENSLVEAESKSMRKSGSS